MEAKWARVSDFALPILLTICSLNFYLIIALNRLRRSELNVGCAVGMDKIIQSSLASVEPLAR